jgi:hypothetical protein
LRVTRRDPDNYDTFVAGINKSNLANVYYNGWWKREGRDWRGKITNSNDLQLLGREGTSTINLVGSTLTINSHDGSRFVLNKR